MQRIGTMLGAALASNFGADLRTRSQGSTADEPKIEFFPPVRKTTREAIEGGYEIGSPCPDPVKCAFCGQKLYHTGITHPWKPRYIARWSEEPEKCTCSQAVADLERIERERAEEAERTARREENERIRARTERLLRDSGIRGRFASRTFSTFEVNQENEKAFRIAKRYADEFADKLPVRDEFGYIPPKQQRNGLFMTGSFGTGKTHLAAAIANQVMSTGTPVICMTMIDLLARIKQTFNGQEEENEDEIMRMYEEIPLLIIDDMGSEQSTEWGSSTIFRIVNARYEAYMPIIVTTNYGSKELARRMTPRIGNAPGDSTNAEKTIDRMFETCIGIDMVWQSWRTR